MEVVAPTGDHGNTTSPNGQPDPVLFGSRDINSGLEDIGIAGTRNDRISLEACESLCRNFEEYLDTRCNKVRGAPYRTHG